MDNYPSYKQASSLDVELHSGDSDEAYLTALQPHFPRLYEEYKPDLVIYIAGADPYQNDLLSGLDISSAGLKKRDRLIIEQARRLKIPWLSFWAEAMLIGSKKQSRFTLIRLKRRLEPGGKVLSNW